MVFRHSSPVIAPHFTLQQKPLCVVATVTKLTEASTDLVLGSPFNLVIPHAIQTFLLNENTQCFSVSRLTLYKIILTDIYFYPLLYPLKTAPLSSLPPPNTHNFFPFPEEGKPHVYHAFIQEFSLPCSDFLELFINRAYLRTREGGYQAQYVIAGHSDLLKYYSFLEAKSV